MLIRTRQLTLAALGAFCVVGLMACGSKEAADQPQKQAPVQEVGVITLKAQDIALNAELPGRTQAFKQAEVRPQVSGIIEKRLFTEGATVKAGDQLYQIEPATYQAAVATAQAELARAEANFAAAKSREARYKDLVSAKAISQQEYDDAKATFGEANASIAAAKAALETARINLKYTRVLAPISGVIGKSNVTEGALVAANQAQVLATIQQLDPIYVDVSQSAEALLSLKRKMREGAVSALDEVSVSLKLSDGSDYEYQGKLQFAGVDVSETTGTVVLRAIFPNPDGLLLPGLFVRTQLPEGMSPKAIVAPHLAIARDRTGKATALVVNAEGTVELRQVTLGRAVGHNWLVESGLNEGDQLIVEGLQKTAPGAPVKTVPAKVTVDIAGE